MKVTFVLPILDHSGGNRVVAMHAAGLLARGHRVDIVVPRPGRQGLTASIGRLMRGQTSVAESSSAASRGSHVEDLGITPIIANRPGPVGATDVPDSDVVVATWWETAEWVLALQRSKGAKAYFVQGFEVFDYTPKDRVEATYRAPLNRITISNWLQAMLARDFGDHDVALVPNGVDTLHFSCTTHARQRDPTVGFIASTTPVKGLDTAVAALSRLRSSLPNLRLRAFGREALTPAAFRGLPIEHTEKLTQEQIRDIYATCDVWLAPSLSEGFGLPVLEAMACRTPVVSTRTGWAAEGIVDGLNGYLAEPLDDAMLAQHLATVLALDDIDWNRMSAAAHRTASAHGWPESTALFEAALLRLIANRAAEAQVTSTFPG